MSRGGLLLGAFLVIVAGCGDGPTTPTSTTFLIEPGDLVFVPESGDTAKRLISIHTYGATPLTALECPVQIDAATAQATCGLTGKLGLNVEYAVSALEISPLASARLSADQPACSVDALAGGYVMLRGQRVTRTHKEELTVACGTLVRIEGAFRVVDANGHIQ
jgi:hypothetical protein